MKTWQRTFDQYREHEDPVYLAEAIANSKAWVKRMGLTPDDQNWLYDHGYCNWAAARGVTGDPGELFLSRFGAGGPIFLRNRVCYVDGHQGSDLDPGVRCLHCGLYEGDTCTCGSPNCWMCND